MKHTCLAVALLLAPTASQAADWVAVRQNRPRFAARLNSVVGVPFCDQGNSMDQTGPSSVRWLWLATLTTFALFALSSDKTLLAAGMLLLGVFAFFNDPLSPTSSRAANPSRAVAASWLCGLIGVGAVLAAGVLAWL